MATTVTEWRKLPLSLAELCIDTTLRCGQSFRWRKINDEWHCALQGRIVSLKQDQENLHYRTTLPSITKNPPPKSKSSSSLTPLTPPSSVPSPCPSPLAPSADASDTTLSLLHSYFALDHSLTDLYTAWSAADANFARRAPRFAGVRILAQDAWEALVAFICSSNNNIARIAQMVAKLCAHYGPLLGHVAGEAFHDFPAPEALAGDGVEAHLRALGFGYRAKYIAQTARTVSRERGPGWLRGLRNPASPAWGAGDAVMEEILEPPSYKAAHEALLQLAGVGPKVADCVCLMGLGWGEAVPVDTHVWQIAQRDYRLGGPRTKTFSKAMYDAVGDHFRAIWGPQAGWAQSVLFTANLRSFADQAAGKEGGGDEVKVEESEGIVVKEKGKRSKKRKSVTMSTAVAVKVEESEGTAAEGKGKSFKKRKPAKEATTAVAVKVEDGVVEMTEVKLSGTRTSKKRRTRA